MASRSASDKKSFSTLLIASTPLKIFSPDLGEFRSYGVQESLIHFEMKTMTLRHVVWGDIGQLPSQ
jgi:hypothetical protein